MINILKNCPNIIEVIFRTDNSGPKIYLSGSEKREIEKCRGLKIKSFKSKCASPYHNTSLLFDVSK